MKTRDQEYRELFMAEALEYYDSMSRHLSELEGNPAPGPALNELFRLMHNLKANALAMGFTALGQVAHHLETLFGLIRDQERSFSGLVVPVVFAGVDALGAMVRAVGAHQPLPDATALLANLDRLVRGEEPLPDETDPADTDTEAGRKMELSDLVYIPVKKLDKLLNLVGELVIDRDRLMTLAQETGHPALLATAQHLLRISDDLQYSVMDARLVDVGVLLNKLPRVARDVATAEAKEVALTLSGPDVQIDRNILQIIADALLHLVRNAVSHGLETPANRQQQGKPAVGQLTLSALSERDQVLIEVRDDGRGIDTEAVRRKALERGLTTAHTAATLGEQAVWAFLFEPGFSMAPQVTDISGRGVGLDVVKLALDSLGGQLRVESQLGLGTTFTLVLPTSIAVKAALLVEVDQRPYAVPLLRTETVLSVQPDQLSVADGVLVTRFRGQAVPLVSLRQLLHSAGNEPLPPATQADLASPQQVLLVEHNNHRLGLVVERFIRQQNIVIKPLSKPLNAIELFGGVTLLGSGQVCLVLDVPALIRLFRIKCP